MLKMADSAVIRHHIPTRPRSSCGRGISDGGMVMLVAATRYSPLLVLPVRVLGMFQVPQRTPAPDHRNRREVVVRRRGSRGPFQRPRIPRIIARRLSFRVGPEGV